MKVVAIDKDGTLVKPKSGQEFVQNPEDQVLLEGVVPALQRLMKSADAVRLFICSNQLGVQRGYKSISDAIAEMRYCLSLLDEQVSETQAKVHSALFCPDEGKTLVVVDRGTYQMITDDLSNYRKPEIGMLEFIFRANFPALTGRYRPNLVIGDRPEDQGMAQAYGVDFIHADHWRLAP